MTDEKGMKFLLNMENGVTGILVSGFSKDQVLDLCYDLERCCGYFVTPAKQENGTYRLVPNDTIIIDSVPEKRQFFELHFGEYIDNISFLMDDKAIGMKNLLDKLCKDLVSKQMRLKQLEESAKKISLNGDEGDRAERDQSRSAMYYEIQRLTSVVVKIKTLIDYLKTIGWNGNCEGCSCHLPIKRVGLAYTLLCTKCTEKNN